jgi:hypothetical protein
VDVGAVAHGLDYIPIWVLSSPQVTRVTSRTYGIFVQKITQEPLRHLGYFDNSLWSSILP